MNKKLEKISRAIRTHWPEAEISVIKSDRDHIGPLLSVRSKTENGLHELSRSLDHIVVELDSSQEDLHILVVPIEPTEVEFAPVN